MKRILFTTLSVILISCLTASTFIYLTINVEANNIDILPNNEFVLADINLNDFMTLDPALAYDLTPWQVIQQIYEPLIAFNRDKIDEFVPQLADSWNISENGYTYTFHVRPDITFHEGQNLTAQDVAYTFQRGLLQGGYSSPQWLLTEAFLGVGINDITCIVDNCASADDRESLISNPPEVLVQACETVKSKIVADNDNGTVTMTLAQPWPPLLATLAGPVGSILNQSWVSSLEGWDGSCNTWQYYYAMQRDEDPLTLVTNGTGPFKLDAWTFGSEIVLGKNPNYWRTTPMWVNGPSGLAKFDKVTFRYIDSDSEAVEMLINGSADYASLSRSSYETLDSHVLARYNPDGSFRTMGDDPNGNLIAYDNLLGVIADVGLFNYNISTTSPYIGSGTWGSGIPTNFFTDIHIRKAFNYAFNWNAFIEQAYNGYGMQTKGPIIKGLMGYNDSQLNYTYNPSAAISEMNIAFGGLVRDNGFTMTCVYNEGNLVRQKICEILKSGIEALNPSKFHMNVIGLDWSAYLSAQRNNFLPFMTGGWLQDIPHPHNWVVPYLTGTYAYRQNLPQTFKNKYAAKMTYCLYEQGDNARLCYEDIQSETYSDALDIFLAQSLEISYLNATIKGYYYSIAYDGLYIYALSKDPVVLPDSNTVVSFTDNQGNQGSLLIPAGMIDESVQLVLLPDIDAQPLNDHLMNSSMAFSIQGYRLSDGSPIKLAFDSPIPLTIFYTNTPIIEDTLKLFYWNDTGWEDAACGDYTRDLEANKLIVPICHFSQFQMGGNTNWDYLPVISR